jgi:hypothetical protein
MGVNTGQHFVNKICDRDFQGKGELLMSAFARTGRVKPNLNIPCNKISKSFLKHSLTAIPHGDSNLYAWV